MTVPRDVTEESARQLVAAFALTDERTREVLKRRGFEVVTNGRGRFGLSIVGGIVTYEGAGFGTLLSLSSWVPRRHLEDAAPIDGIGWYEAWVPA